MVKRNPAQAGLLCLILNDIRQYAELLAVSGRRADAARQYAEGEKIAEGIDPDKTSFSYVAAAAHLSHDFAVSSSARRAITKEATAWCSLADRKVAGSYVTPRLAAAEKRAAACKP